MNLELDLELVSGFNCDLGCTWAGLGLSISICADLDQGSTSMSNMDPDSNPAFYIGLELGVWASKHMIQPVATMVTRTTE